MGIILNHPCACELECLEEESPFPLRYGGPIDARGWKVRGTRTEDLVRTTNLDNEDEEMQPQPQYPHSHNHQKRNPPLHVLSGTLLSKSKLRLHNTSLKERNSNSLGRYHPIPTGHPKTCPYCPLHTKTTIADSCCYLTIYERIKNGRIAEYSSLNNVKYDVTTTIITLYMHLLKLRKLPYFNTDLT